MKKVLKHVGRALGIVLLALVLVVGGYVLYMQLNYYRIEDHQALDVEQPNPAELALGQEYTAVTTTKLIRDTPTSQAEPPQQKYPTQTPAALRERGVWGERRFSQRSGLSPQNLPTPRL